MVLEFDNQTIYLQTPVQYNTIKTSFKLTLKLTLTAQAQLWKLIKINILKKFPKRPNINQTL